MNPVGEQTATQKALENKRMLPAALSDGTEAMRIAGKTYLPKHPAESEEAWRSRKEGSVLLPAYRDAVDLACGLIFRKPVEVGADIPDEYEEWLENIDLTGRDVTQFAQDVLRDAFMGVTYIVADYPRVPVGATLAQERDMGARPYLIHVKAHQVLGWRSQMINGKPKLTQFRYLETTTVPDGMFGEKVIKRVRVLEPGMVTVWDKVEDQGDYILTTEDSGVVSIKDVPVIPVYTGRTAFMQGLPPLLDLAWKNVEHWQSASDQRNILHVARVPLLATIGADSGDVIIGPQNILALPMDGDVKWVEHSGKAIEAGRTDLQDLEAQMQRMAGKMLDRGTVKTALEAGVESTQAMSRIQAWAVGLQAGLNQAWAMAGEWIGQDLGTLAVNTDVDTSQPDPQFLTEIRNAVVAGLLTRETYLRILDQAEVLPSGFDVQEELDRLDMEGPGPMLPGKPGAPGAPGAVQACPDCGAKGKTACCPDCGAKMPKGA